MKGKPWTKKEDEKLWELYIKGVLIKICAHTLGRTLSAVNSRLRVIKQGNIVYKERTPWDENEVKMLNAMYAKGVPVSKMAQEFNTTKQAVKSKLSRLRPEGYPRRQVEK
jgi:hypothetical protein